MVWNRNSSTSDAIEISGGLEKGAARDMGQSHVIAAGAESDPPRTNWPPMARAARFARQRLAVVIERARAVVVNG